MMIMWDAVSDLLDVAILGGDFDVAPTSAEYFDVVGSVFGGTVECDAVSIVEGGGWCLG